MDYADDIAYSVHDLEDFHRCRLIPWRTIFSDEGRDELVAGVLADRSAANKNELELAHSGLKSLVEGMVGDLLDSPYEATREQRQVIRQMTSEFIGRYVRAARLRVPSVGQNCLEIPKSIQNELAILKQVTRRYILATPALRG